MPLPDEGIKIAALPAASSPDAIDLVGVQAGVTKKLASTLLATQAELDAHVATAWQTWAPTVTPGGSMTATATAHPSNHARYVVVGKVCHVSYSQLFTFGGTASGVISFSLPFAGVNNRLIGTGDIINVIARCNSGDGKLAIDLRRYDGADFLLAAYHASFHLTYEVA